MKQQLKIAAALSFAWFASHACADSLVTATATAEFAVSNTASDPISATVSAISNDAVGSSLAVADIGAFHNYATATGCGPDPLFQQPCNSSTSYSSFNDNIHVGGSAPGTNVMIEFDWTVDGSVEGTGTFGLQSRLIVGNLVQEIDDGTAGLTQTFYGQPIGGTRSIIIMAPEGSTIGIAAFTSLGVGERFCDGGTQNCAPSLDWEITADLENTSFLTATVLTPGLDVTLIGDSGHDYLASFDESAATPEPANFLLIGAGLLIFAIARRKR